jgi:hypothetical protein
MHATPGCIDEDPRFPRVHVWLLVQTVADSTAPDVPPLAPPLAPPLEVSSVPPHPSTKSASATPAGLRLVIPR